MTTGKTIALTARTFASKETTKGEYLNPTRGSMPRSCPSGLKCLSVHSRPSSDQPSWIYCHHANSLLSWKFQLNDKSSCIFSKPPHNTVLLIKLLSFCSVSGRPPPHHWSWPPGTLALTLCTQEQPPDSLPAACAQEYSQNEKADPSRSKRGLLVWLSSTRTLSFPVYRPELKHQLFVDPEPECFWIGAHTTASPGALAHPWQCWGLLSLHICVKSIMNIYTSFPGLSNKESTANAGDAGLIPGLGRTPWRRKWQPIPVFLP